MTLIPVSFSNSSITSSVSAYTSYVTMTSSLSFSVSPTHPERGIVSSSITMTMLVIFGLFSFLFVFLISLPPLALPRSGLWVATRGGLSANAPQYYPPNRQDTLTLTLSFLLHERVCPILGRLEGSLDRPWADPPE